MEENKDLYNELETSLAYGYEMTIRKTSLVLTNRTTRILCIAI